ncbi:MAG: hypothetical protein HOP07_15770 [Bacteriovoracaceae bacterium]|nr:hypothetical protein [Bacteriovoracaceae bacterium]
MFILYSSCLFSNEERNNHFVVESATQVLKEIPKIGSTPQLICEKNNFQIDFIECVQAKELNKSIEKNFKVEGWKRNAELDSQVKACFQKRFEHCYTNLKKNIELEEIIKLFNTWKKDPRFRYPSGAGMCNYRAETLSHFLAELGYQSKTIRIRNSPTLIAMDRDSEDNLNGNYDDYQGEHTIVQIIVKTEDGNEMPYLLDPQYMTKPETLNNYFIKVTGQICEKISIKLLDKSKCTYEEQPQNQIPDGHDLFNPEENSNTALNCGWSKKDVGSRISIWPNPITKSDMKIVKTNGGKTPKLFEEENVTENTSRRLIIKAYEDYAESLNNKLLKVNSEIEAEKNILFDKKDKSPENLYFIKEFTEISQERQTTKKSLLETIENITERIRIVKINLGQE